MSAHRADPEGSCTTDNSQGSTEVVAIQGQTQGREEGQGRVTEREDCCGEGATREEG